jgi:ribosome-associated protein
MTTNQSHQVLSPAAELESKSLALYLADLLDDRQAHDIVMLHVGPLVGYTEWFVVASGKSDRQVKALASYVERSGRGDGVRPLGTEGTERGHWALVDYGDVIVHVFRDEERYFYDLESLWAEATKLTYPPEGHIRPERPAMPDEFVDDDRPYVDEAYEDEDLDGEAVDAYDDEDEDGDDLEGGDEDEDGDDLEGGDEDDDEDGDDLEDGDDDSQA